MISDILPRSTGGQDFDDVNKELTPLANRWKFIGAALGIPSTELDNIESSQHGLPEECLAKMVIAWLSKRYNTNSFGQPTWKKLIEVVAEPAAGNDAAQAKAMASFVDTLHKHRKDPGQNCNGAGTVTMHHSSTNRKPAPLCRKKVGLIILLLSYHIMVYSWM